MARSTKRWSDLERRQQRLIVAGGVVELVLTVIATRDLVQRPGNHVHGRKSLWLLSFVIQPFGPIAYLVRGRRVD